MADVVVVGAGHNGLVAALELASQGYETVVVERNDRVGGAVASGEVTVPGFVHDLYATNLNLFLASPVYQRRAADLERHGLRFAVTEKPFSSVFAGDRAIRVYRDAERTLALLREHSADDAAGWERLAAQFERFAPLLFGLYGMALPSGGAGLTIARALREHGAGGMAELARIVLSSTRELGEAYFATEEMRALIAPWGMHLDFGPDVAGGAMFPFLETFADQANGMAVAEGGASRLPEALAALVLEAGGVVRTGAEVTRIVTAGGRATGVELASGERIEARRAVLANLAPPLVFGRLLDPSADGGAAADARTYRYGPATMVVHLALREPLRWTAADDLHEFGYVHIGGTVDDMARTSAQAAAGQLPDRPLLVVGQTSAIDPTRVPDGAASLWIQVRVLPRTPPSGSWREVQERYAEQVIDLVEEHAPGVRDRLLGIAVASPEDLERDVPTLVGGDSLGGSHHLRQNFLLRPIPGWSRYRTPLDGLFLCGSSTWPGAGVNAVSGSLAAEAIVAAQRTRIQRMTVVAGSALRAVRAGRAAA
jgi:phytoene dehydrogenase-like protein